MKSIGGFVEKRTKVTIWLFVSSLVCIVAHNMIYGIWQLEEPLFTLAALVFIVAFLIATVWNSYTRIRFGWPADIWKVAYIGFFGLIGFIPTVHYWLCIFFVLFFLFLLKNNKPKIKVWSNWWLFMMIICNIVRSVITKS